MKKLILILVPLLLLGGGGFLGVAYMGIVKVPGITTVKKRLVSSKEERPASYLFSSTLKVSKRLPDPTVKPKPPVIDPKPGQKKIADLWSQMEPKKVAEIAANLTDTDVAPILVQMKTDLVAKIIAAMEPDRAATLCTAIKNLTKKA